MVLKCSTNAICTVFPNCLKISMLTSQSRKLCISFSLLLCEGLITILSLGAPVAYYLPCRDHTGYVFEIIA